jgi:glutamate formiminotransferase / 5-formyltetrahydrofolate cyclo-ligase
VLECVVNISEGRDRDALDALARECGHRLLDIHRDPVHNRSVFTLLGTEAPRRLTAAAVDRLSLPRHHGVHPRLGVVDVVPFVPLEGATIDDAVRARDEFANWAATDLGVPVFLYGPLPGGDERTLPEIRRRAFVDLAPDVGPATPHPTAGAVCVGARPFLIAYNVWLDATTPRVDVKRISDAVRGDGIRSLPLVDPGFAQVSMNLVDCDRVGPAEAYDRVCEKANDIGFDIDRAELVGLLPRSVLMRIPERRWRELDLAEDRTIEARISDS